MTPRNPWNGIDPWRELKHDVRHPIAAVRGWVANVNHVDPRARRLCCGVIAVGAANALLSIVVVITH